MTNKDPSSSNEGGYCLQISTNSSLSCESDLSSFSFDKELETYTSRGDSDEMPAFQIRLISPLGRSPSPIDSDLEFFSSPTKSCITPTRTIVTKKLPGSSYKDNEDFVPLQDINAQISPPSDNENNSICDSPLASLETIFEGVFLNTPPRQKSQRRSNSSSINRCNLMEKIAINRLNLATTGKENVHVKEGGSNTTSTTGD